MNLCKFTSCFIYSDINCTVQYAQNELLQVQVGESELK